MNLPKMLNPHVTCWTSGTQLSSRLAPACRIEAEMVDAAQVQHLLGIQPPAGPHPSREHGNGLASIPRWGAILKPFCSKLSKPCRGHTKGKKPLVDHGKKPIKTWYLLTLGMIHGMLITGMMIWDNLGSWYRDDSGLGWSLFGPEIYLVQACCGACPRFSTMRSWDCQEWVLKSIPSHGMWQSQFSKSETWLLHDAIYRCFLLQ
jgi:hypothetical protein